MRILFASSEVFPYSKTGGLADMVAALAKSLAKAGHEIGVVTPLYRGLRERHPELAPFAWKIDLPLGEQAVSATVWVARPRANLTVYFIDQPRFFQRDGLYDREGVDFEDNAERFIFFSKCVAQMARYMAWRPELVHVHDWHMGLVPLLVRDQARNDGWATPPATCLTIHNVAFQGNYPQYKYRLTNLPPDYFTTEAMEYHGTMSLLKAGIVFAQAIIAVSPSYAKEIQTPQAGCGLEGVLLERADVLSGILNGVDYDEWRTVGNPYLPHSYDAHHLSGKTANKLALQAELGLPVRADVPLFATVSRLTDQKGMDIELGALEEMLANDSQFVLLGRGAPEFERGFRALAGRYPEKAAVRIAYDHGLAHRIEAGADFFIMPSMFEPCGLNQMYSLRYGTVPIVRAVGGLDDSVIDVREDSTGANGIKFHEYAPAALVKAMQKALALYAQPPLLLHYRQNGMAADFSWERTTERYLAIYSGLLDRPTPGAAD